MKINNAHRILLELPEKSIKVYLVLAFFCHLEKWRNNHTKTKEGLNILLVCKVKQIHCQIWFKIHVSINSFSEPNSVVMICKPDHHLYIMYHGHFNYKLDALPASESTYRFQKEISPYDDHICSS